MKAWLLSISFIAITFAANGQILKMIEITFSKSTHIYFPTKIEYVDVGVPDDIGWQKMENMIKLTALIEGFEYESNMTVHTEKGIYMFNIRYNKDLQRPIFFIKESDLLKRFEEVNQQQETISDKDSLLLASNNSLVQYQSQTKDVQAEEANFKQEKQLCKAILEKAPTIGDVGSYKYKVFAVVTGIYANGNKIYMKLEMKNDSALDFEISYQNFYTKVKKGFKKSVIAPEEIKPLFVMNASDKIVPANGGIVKMVLVFDKFFVDDTKRLYCEIGEDEARFIKFQINSKYIVNAKAI